MGTCHLRIEQPSPCRRHGEGTQCGVESLSLHRTWRVMRPRAYSSQGCRQQKQTTKSLMPQALPMATSVGNETFAPVLRDGDETAVDLTPLVSVPPAPTLWPGPLLCQS